MISNNRIRVIKSEKPLERDYFISQTENYNKETYNITKSDYSYKRALDNLIWTIDSNITPFSKFMTLTFRDAELDYTKAIKKFNRFTLYFKRHFKFKLEYSRIAERQSKRGIKENNEGSWHFHIIVYIDKKIDFKLLKKCWPYGSIDLKLVDFQKNIALYFGKYFNKQKSDIAINKNLVSHSQGLKKPIIIYENDIDTFDNYKITYYKHYKSPDNANSFLLVEYELPCL